MYHTSRPLSSRVVGRSHLQPLTFKDMKNYIKHHLDVVKFTDHLFSDEAVVAIQQVSGGLLRKANILAKGSLIAAASESTITVTAEHVRIASTEII